MNLHISTDGDSFNHSVASWIVELIHGTLEKQDRFTCALSGGHTPQSIYELLAGPIMRDAIPWNKMHIFWGDERAVPFTDGRNNAKMAYDCLLDKVPIIPSQVHVMRTDIPPQESALEYEKMLRAIFAISNVPSVTHENLPVRPLPVTFDLVLLGMGDDGHTLSLFPGTPLIDEKSDWVKAFFLPSQDMFRITLTPPIVNLSRQVAFLATGPDKAEVLHQVLEGPHNPSQYPSQVIKPENGRLDWFVDEAAAALLTKRA